MWSNGFKQMIVCKNYCVNYADEIVVISIYFCKFRFLDKFVQNIFLQEKLKTKLIMKEGDLKRKLVLILKK